MSKKVLVFLFSALLCLMAAGCGNGQSDPDASPQGPDSAQVIVLKLAHELPDAHPWGAGAERFKEIVEAESNGQMLVEIYGNGQLGGSSKEVQESVLIGSLELGISSTPMETLNPYMKLFALPYIFEDSEEAWEILDGPVGKAVAGHAEEAGVHVLAFWEDGMRQVTNNVRPILVPEDLKGIKLRVPESTVRIATFEALGANPVSMPFSEVFTSLQQHTIDGQENPLSVISSSSFYECQKYLSITNHVYSPASLIINLKVWESLTPKQQDILEKAAEAGRDLNRQLSAENDDRLIEELKDKGMQVNELTDLSAFQDKMQPVWDSVIEELGDEGRQLFDQLRSEQGKQ